MISGYEIMYRGDALLDEAASLCPPLSRNRQIIEYAEGMFRGKNICSRLIRLLPLPDSLSFSKPLPQ